MAMRRRRAGGQPRGRRNPASYAPGRIRNAAGGGARRRLNQYGIHDSQAAGVMPWLQGMHMQSGMASAAGRPGGNGFSQMFPPGFARGKAWWKQGEQRPGKRKQGQSPPFNPNDRNPQRIPGRPNQFPWGGVPGKRMPGQSPPWNPGGPEGGGTQLPTPGAGPGGEFGLPNMRRYTRRMQRGYRRATGMPLDPNYILARTQAQGQLSGSLAGLSAQRGFLGAQNQLGLSRLGTEQGIQTDLLNEQLAGRGIYGSSIATDDRFKLNTGYTRQRQDMANTLLQNYGQIGSQANQSWLDYQNAIGQALYSSARSNTNSPGVAKRRTGRRR